MNNRLNELDRDRNANRNRATTDELLRDEYPWILTFNLMDRRDDRDTDDHDANDDHNNGGNYRAIGAYAETGQTKAHWNV